NREELSDAIRQRYGRAAIAARNGATACCDSTCCSTDPITGSLYADTETRDLPAEAVSASLWCGNPTALIDLAEGETVLDLGSGGGIDVLLSAKRVGEAGKVYGLDMTDEMLSLARANQQKSGLKNVEFLRGYIERIPLPDESVDVIISNCVINLSADKRRVFEEAFRVLKPGGRFAVSDVVVLGDVPDAVRRSMELWVGGIAGAIRETEYVAQLAAAGFKNVSVEPWRVYDPADASDAFAKAGISPDALKSAEGKFTSAFVRATKPPRQAACCGPD